MKTRKLLTVLFIFSTSATSLFAQLGEIRGKITDKDHKNTPLPGVSVYVERAGKHIGSFTDEKGNYVIKPLNPGTYILHVSMMGYQQATQQNVQVSTDNITYVDLALQEMTVDLPPIIVSDYESERKLINKDGGNICEMTPKEIENSPLMREPKALIATFSDVKLGPNGKDLYIRGARPTSTVFFVDGVKSMDGELSIPGNAMGSLKVYTGGVPARYGDVSGGVVAVETKSYFDVIKAYRLKSE